MNSVKKQTTLFRGIYEFEDPSGCLLAARIPLSGSADLYKGTAVTVRPNQCAIFVYKGQIADVLPKGLHSLDTDNVPILTRMANWKFGFESPLRAEIWFFSGSVFAARRWGTAQPVLVALERMGTVPIRGYGNYSLLIKDPIQLYQKLIGSRTSLDITEVEDFVQGQLLEILPLAIQAEVKTVADLNRKQAEVAKRVYSSLTNRLMAYGLAVRDVQVLSLLPTKEVLDALDAQVAMKVIGNQKEYLLYKAATSMGVMQGGNDNDPLQMMLGLMVGKGLMGADYHTKEANAGVPTQAIVPTCQSCGQGTTPNARYCSHCGKEQS